MSWEGWAFITAIVVGVAGGLILWTMHGLRGGNDT